MREGWQVKVITRELADHGPTQLPELGPNGEQISRVPGDNATGVGLRRIFDLVRFPWAAWRSARRMPRADVVLADPPPTVGLAALILARQFKGVPVYYFADPWGRLLRSSNSRVGPALGVLVGLLERMVLKASGLVLTVTPGFARQAGQYSNEVVLVLNGVDGSVFRYCDSTDGLVHLDLPAVPYFLYAGNYGEAHAASIFARAALLDWRAGKRTYGVVFMGYGSDAQAIHGAAAEFPDLCKSIPPQPPTIAAAAFRGAVGGLASVKPSEHMSDAVSVKALASIMCGAPLVYVGGGPFFDEVEARRYGVALPHNEGSVAQALEQFAQSPWTPHQRSELAARAAERYDNRIQAVQLVEAVGQKLRVLGPS